MDSDQSIIMNNTEESCDEIANATRTSNTTTIHLPTLAIHCIYSTLLASNTIQTMAQTISKQQHKQQQHQYHQQEQEQETCDSHDTTYRKIPSQSRIKEDGSIVTDADGAAQRIIYNEIYKVCKDIKITGEESDLEMDHCHSSDQNVDQSSIITSASCGLEDVNEFQWIQQEFHSHYDEKRIEGQIPESTSSSSVVDCSRVCVFVDPLDGTSSYAKGEYDAVTILIAIILDNVPIFGVIAKPFVNPNDDSHGVETENGCPPWRDTGCSIIYGGSLIQGVFYLGGGELQRSVEWKEKQKSQQQQHYQQQQHQEETIQQTETDTHQRRKRRAIISKSKMGGCVGRCIESLSSKDLIHPEPSYISGAGMKTMKLVIGSNDESLWFFPKPGTSLWDVAAADALLRVMGGRISDGCGNDLDYSKGRLEGENMQGIIACIDSSLHAICLELYHDEKWHDVNE